MKNHYYKNHTIRRMTERTPLYIVINPTGEVISNHSKLARAKRFIDTIESAVAVLDKFTEMLEATGEAV